MLGGTESFFTFDRILATVAIIVGVAGIWRAEHLFKRLNERADKMTEEFLRSATTIVVSYASFTKALQAIELAPTELPKWSAPLNLQESVYDSAEQGGVSCRRESTAKRR